MLSAASSSGKHARSAAAPRPSSALAAALAIRTLVVAVAAQFRWSAAQLGDAAALHLNWAATATTKVRMARAAASALDGRGAAALRACLPLLEAAESRRREGHK